MHKAFFSEARRERLLLFFPRTLGRRNDNSGSDEAEISRRAGPILSKENKKTKIQTNPGEENIVRSDFILRFGRTRFEQILSWGRRPKREGGGK